MVFDYTALKSLMVSKGYNQSSLAMEMKMHEGAFSNRMNNQRSFRQEEIIRMCKILGIKPTDIGKYFFTIEHNADH